ncbi:MAG: hypothetical protein A3E07_00565 [Candidatus Wildermuthbacteria bacterium RIFCSPHIGHO2_12_FULL_45_9]|nr:MAG: hypothetical protein A2748_00350 [Candidatus Wildermuthbacteria bacterium RIFCSPHIGHO2_01_FULL_45_20]OHA70288.1 MAG: hypothetical protein A3E07_00565 [Candidatus Wildermuthbacteria bacterium RIFCSPHIGHO2_12_FULL_45_9]
MDYRGVLAFFLLRLSVFVFKTLFHFMKPTFKKNGKTITVSLKPNHISALRTQKEYLREQQLLFALEKASTALTAEVDIEKILEDMAIIVAKALGAKWVNFWGLTPDKTATHIVASYGMKKSYVEHSRNNPIQLGKAWIGRAIQTGRAWGSSDVLTDPNLMPDLGPAWEEQIRKQSYRALLCVPTHSKKGTVGGMCVYYPDPHEFNDFEMRLVTVAANQAATSMVNAQTVQDLAAERNKTVAIINSLSDGILMYDLEDRITALNLKAQELLGISAKSALGKTTSELNMQTNPLFENLQTISKLLIQEFESQEFTLAQPQRTILVITHLPVRNSKNQKIGSMQVLHDITKEKETEELKANFVSIASHQLRTPLSRMKWALSVLRDLEYGPLAKEQDKLLEETSLTLNNLILLVNDLLDTSKMEQGKFEYNFKPLSLEKLFRNLERLIQPLLQEKSKTIVLFEGITDNPPTFLADLKKLEMAIFNIVENAIKYTPVGTVHISAQTKDNSVFIEIKDRGIGIPKDQQKHIFTKFFRAHNAVLLQTEGSGLGLWIANEIIKKHQGKILVESKQGKGTTLTVVLPIAHENAAPPPETPKPKKNSPPRRSLKRKT